MEPVANEGVILPSINMRTAGGPMAALERAARQAATGSVLEVSVFGGFPYADTAATGAAVFVVSDAAGDPDCGQAQAAAHAVMRRIHELASEFRASLPGPDEAVAQALAHGQAGLVAVTESSDNPLSGGGGDTPGLFSAMLRLEDLPAAWVIVTERVVAGDDSGFYALHGIDPAALRLLCAKAKNHFRAAFADLCARIIDCDTPGPACLDLSLLPFRHRHIPSGY